ncbi:hypothetical protein [Methanosarcina sp. UBA5]|uniref:hypothetical protein n=1 Tax=Methanosarcina sp. UBA5 TaxID=1915593 RepID=UPI0025EEFDAC|nr:hypothetical protein [Methanosarcina sp. UBA5]
MEKENLRRNALKTETSPLGKSSLSLENRVFPIVIKKRSSQQKPTLQKMRHYAFSWCLKNKSNHRV